MAGSRVFSFYSKASTFISLLKTIIFLLVVLQLRNILAHMNRNKKFKTSDKIHRNTLKQSTASSISSYTTIQTIPAVKRLPKLMQHPRANSSPKLIPLRHRKVLNIARERYPTGRARLRRKFQFPKLISILLGMYSVQNRKRRVYTRGRTINLLQSHKSRAKTLLARALAHVSSALN